MTASPALTLPVDLLKPSSQPRQALLQHLRLSHLIYHRSKNQHRRSLWFRHFNTFRREVARLCGDLGIDVSRGLGEHVDDVVKDVGKNSATKKSSFTTRSKVLNLNKQQDRAVARRKALARIQYWVGDGLVVKWYTSFTTITATPSFTPLALTLLALLARIYSIMGIVSHITAVAEFEEQERQAEEEEEMQRALAKFAEVDAQGLWESAEKRSTKFDVPGGNDDFGVVLAREDVIKAVPSTSKSIRSSMHAKSGPALHAARYESKIRASPLVQSSDEAAPRRKAQVTEGVSSKKRKQEIAEKENKRSGIKKSRKSKNEIDALFAGLG